MIHLLVCELLCGRLCLGGYLASCRFDVLLGCLLHPLLRILAAGHIVCSIPYSPAHGRDQQSTCKAHTPSVQHLREEGVQDRDAAPAKQCVHPVSAQPDVLDMTPLVVRVGSSCCAASCNTSQLPQHMARSTLHHACGIHACILSQYVYAGIFHCQVKDQAGLT